MQRIISGFCAFAEKQWRMLKSKVLMIHGQNSSTDVGVKQAMSSIAQVINDRVHLNSIVKSPTLQWFYM
jgi:hypothetical protein